jgi:glycosyltransferase involved in cell wall biosynthesis
LEFEFARQAGSPAWPRRLANGLIARVLHAEEGRALRRARNVFTASHYMAEMLPRWHGAELPPVKVVFGGVNAGRFQPAADRVAVRKKLRLSPEDFLFVAVRRLDPRMGLLTLLDGFAAVTGEFPNARLCLAGTGPQRDELESRIRSLGLGEQVRLAGFVPEPELPELLSAADCTLMPSLDLEGFGLATVESLACGTPVLGSRAGGTPELLAPLSEKLIFDAGSANALAAKLREILSNPGSLPSREQCRDYAVKNFSWDRVASAFEESLTELCPAGGGA